MSKTHHRSRRQRFVIIQRTYSRFSDMPISNEETVILGFFGGEGYNKEERRQDAILLAIQELGLTNIDTGKGINFQYIAKTIDECSSYELAEASLIDDHYDMLEEESEGRIKIKRNWSIWD